MPNAKSRSSKFNKNNSDINKMSRTFKPGISLISSCLKIIAFTLLIFLGFSSHYIVVQDVLFSVSLNIYHNKFICNLLIVLLTINITNRYLIG